MNNINVDTGTMSRLILVTAQNELDRTIWLFAALKPEAQTMRGFLKLKKRIRQFPKQTQKYELLIVLSEL